MDIKSVNVVYGLLKKIDSFILVSHDRELLDFLCTKIWEVKGGKILEYPGNFSDYLACQSIKEVEEWREYEKYINEKNVFQILQIKKERRQLK